MTPELPVELLVGTLVFVGALLAVYYFFMKNDQLCSHDYKEIDRKDLKSVLDTLKENGANLNFSSYTKDELVELTKPKTTITYKCEKCNKILKVN